MLLADWREKGSSRQVFGWGIEGSSYSQDLRRLHLEDIRLTRQSTSWNMPEKRHISTRVMNAGGGTGSHTACKVFENVQLLTLSLSTVSNCPLYWPILPIATPKPLKNRELVIEMSVLFALREILSSPFSTVQLLNAIWWEYIVSAPSVLA